MHGVETVTRLYIGEGVVATFKQCEICHNKEDGIKVCNGKVILWKTPPSGTFETRQQLQTWDVARVKAYECRRVPGSLKEPTGTKACPD